MNEKGQGVIEFVLILFVLVITAAIILTALGEHLANTVNTIGDELGITSFEAVTVDDAAALASAQEIEALGGYSMLPVMEATGMYSDLPLTLDAQTHHEFQKWNSKSIAEYFDNRGCAPKIDICEDYDIEIHWCRMNDKKAIALVIGHTIRQVVTGYMADLKYWENKCP